MHRSATLDEPPRSPLCGKAASRFAGPAFGCPSAFGLVFAAPRGGTGLPWGGPAGRLTQISDAKNRRNRRHAESERVEVRPQGAFELGNKAFVRQRRGGEGRPACGGLVRHR